MNLYSNRASAAFDDDYRPSLRPSRSATVWSPQIESTVISELPRPNNWIVAGDRIFDYLPVLLGYSSPTNPELSTESSSITSSEESENRAPFQPTKDRLDSYKARIETLREYGVEDEIDVNVSSELDFWRFAVSDPRICVDNLVLLENGNLRAVWRDTDGTHLGLQFLGGGSVQYVIFKRRHKRQPIARVTGSDTFEGFTKQIRAFDLHSLITE